MAGESVCGQTSAPGSLGLLVRCAGARRTAAGRLRRQCRPHEGRGQPAALPDSSARMHQLPLLPRGRLPQSEQAPRRSRRTAARRSTQAQRGFWRGSRVGRASSRSPREDRTTCSRRCEGQRRSLLGGAYVAGQAASTSNRLRGRPVAATALGDGKVDRRPSQRLHRDEAANDHDPMAALHLLRRALTCSVAGRRIIPRRPLLIPNNW